MCQVVFTLQAQLQRYGPDCIECTTEAVWNAILAFAQFLKQLNADQHTSGVVELLEAKHVLNPRFDSTVILFDSLIANDNRIGQLWEDRLKRVTHTL